MRRLLFSLMVLCVLVRLACANVTVYAKDLSGFNSAAGNPPVVIDFDSIPAGTDIGGQTISGVEFLQTDAPLIVVVGTNTVTPVGAFIDAL